MNLYIVRHGNPNYDLDCLTPLGHEQAEAAAEALEALGIDEIYASPMGRARETAAHLAERIGKSVTIEPWAHEVEAYAKRADGSPVQLVSIGGDFLRSPELISMGEGWPDHPRFDGADVRGVIDEVEGGLADFMRRQGYVLDGERFRALPFRPSLPLVPPCSWRLPSCCTRDTTACSWSLCTLSRGRCRRRCT